MYKLQVRDRPEAEGSREPQATYCYTYWQLLTTCYLLLTTQSTCYLLLATQCPMGGRFHVWFRGSRGLGEEDKVAPRIPKDHVDRVFVHFTHRSRSGAGGNRSAARLPPISCNCWISICTNRPMSSKCSLHILLIKTINAHMIGTADAPIFKNPT